MMNLDEPEGAIVAVLEQLKLFTSSWVLFGKNLSFPSIFPCFRAKTLIKNDMIH